MPKKAPVVFQEGGNFLCRKKEGCGSCGKILEGKNSSFRFKHACLKPLDRRRGVLSGERVGLGLEGKGG